MTEFRFALTVLMYALLVSVTYFLQGCQDQYAHADKWAHFLDENGTSPGEPAEPSTCLNNCDVNGNYHCKERIEWKMSRAGGSLGQDSAISFVNAECKGQCSCDASDFNGGGGGGSGGCCGNCNGASPFCSPVSGNCYQSKNKDYYQSCAMGPTPPPTPAPPPCMGPQCKDIQVMSYNTEYVGYPSRRSQYAAKIKEVRPDIVGLQECQNRDGLANDAGYTALTGTGGQNYIVYDSSKLVFVSDGNMPILRDNYAQRAITWGEYKLGDTNIWFFNTHLPHNHNEAASQSSHGKIARSFLQKRKELGAENAPTIVVGDMNSFASNWNQASGGGFESNLRANGFTLAYTARGNPGHGRIDKILYSTMHWDHKNCRDTGTGGSDHTSIACDLVLKR